VQKLEFEMLKKRTNIYIYIYIIESLFLKSFLPICILLRNGGGVKNKSADELPTLKEYLELKQLYKTR
jgi:hypothetical protein